MVDNKPLTVKTGTYVDLQRNLFRVVAIAQSIETGERVVVFVPQQGERIGQCLTQNAADFEAELSTKSMTWCGGPTVQVRKRMSKNARKAISGGTNGSDIEK